MEEEKTPETKQSTTVTFELGFLTFIIMLASVALNLLFAFILYCGAGGVAGVTMAFRIIKYLVYMGALTLYVIPLFKDRKVSLDGTLVLLIIATLTLMLF